MNGSEGDAGVVSLQHSIWTGRMPPVAQAVTLTLPGRQYVRQSTQTADYPPVPSESYGRESRYATWCKPLARTGAWGSEVGWSRRYVPGGTPYAARNRRER